MNDLIKRQIQIEDTLYEMYGVRPTRNSTYGDRYGLLKEWHEIDDKIREMQDRELSNYEYI